MSEVFTPAVVDEYRGRAQSALDGMSKVNRERLASDSLKLCDEISRLHRIIQNMRTSKSGPGIDDPEFRSLFESIFGKGIL